MRVASVSVGIVAYADPRLASSHARLHYAGEDAMAFHRYATTGWADDWSLHLRLIDGDASREGLDDAFGKVALAGRLDLFLLYLSGHGETADGRGWFCLADAESGVPSLTVEELDQHLERIDADRVLVVADYCYAEASLAGSRFFADLDGRSARVFVTSARRDQQAWEDNGLRRSILSDVLLKALAAGSPIAERDGTVDLEARLIPHLREQVPLEAAARKRGRTQEPVAGGSAASPIRLPTVAGGDMRRPLSIAETLKARLRRILGVAAAVALAAWAITDLLVYHLAIDPTGAIQVRPGPAALYELTPFHLGARTDTGFTVDDLSAVDQDAFRRLSQGEQVGFTTRDDRSGLATWLTLLEPSLTRAARARAEMLGRAGTVRLNGSSDAPPVRAAAFMAYASGDSARAVADRIYPVPASVDVDCSRPAGQQFDFSLLDVPSEPFARDLAWRALRLDDPRHAGEAVEIVKAVAYRAAHAADSSSADADAEALAGALAIIREGDVPRLPTLAGWCEGSPAALARALLGDRRLRAAEEAALASSLPASPLPPGAEAPRPQAAAVAALTALAGRVSLRPATMDAIVGAVERSGDGLGLDTPLNRLLFVAAAHQALPAGMRQRLFAVLDDRIKAADFDGLVAFRLLGRNARHLTTAERRRLRAWLDANGAANRTMSDLHEALGNLSAVMRLKPVEIGWLVARLSPSSWLPPATVSYRGETIVSASDAEAAVALAKIAGRQQLDEVIVERLRTIAANRSDLPERDALLAGLTTRRDRTGDSVANAVARDLRRARNSSTMRRLGIDTAIMSLRGLPAAERSRGQEALLERWRTARAPEQRIAIAEILGAVAERTH